MIINPTKKKEKKIYTVPSKMKESTVIALDRACEIKGDRTRSWMIEEFCRERLQAMNLL